jgi:Uma2 family endonuclease
MTPMVQTPAKVSNLGNLDASLSEVLPRVDLESFLQLPETKPASEYIDGEIIQKPMPQGEHSTLQRDLLFRIDQEFKPNQVARAFPELRCRFGGRVIVPDVSVFRSARIPRKANGGIANGFEIPPDWVIEILCPDQDPKKVINKILHCLDHGCEMGWMIDPEEQSVIAYPHNDRSRLFSRSATPVLPVPDWATSLQLTAEELFSWLTV